MKNKPLGRVKIKEGSDVGLENNVISKLDKMRKNETADVISRPTMVRILIMEGYNKRFPKLKK